MNGRFDKLILLAVGALAGIGLLHLAMLAGWGGVVVLSQHTPYQEVQKIK